MSDEKDKSALIREELEERPEPTLQPKRDGPLTHAEKMGIARAVMRKNRDVLAALAASDSESRTERDLAERFGIVLKPTLN